MAKIQVPFAMQEGNAGFTQNSGESLVNMFAEIVVSGRSQIIRHQRPGLASVYTQAGEKRAIEKHKGIHYLVVGAEFLTFDGTTMTVKGELASAEGRCTMIFNDNDQVMISDGSLAYYYNGTILQVTTIPAAVTVGTLAYLGGYGIFNDLGTGRFYITALNDFSTVDALDFATAEGSPDNLVTVFVDHNELILAGTSTTEFWGLSGAADFPFAPVTNAILERGCAAGLSYAAEDNTFYFLGDDHVVYKADGYRPVRVSTDPIEDAIRLVTDEARAAAYSVVYTVRGHKFYTLTFPDELTVQLNIATGLWNRARTWLKEDWQVMGARVTSADFLMTPAGICTLDPDISTDEGSILERGGRSAPGENGADQITVGAVHLDCEVGRAEAGVSAEVMMRFARDGETFGNEHKRSLGPIGDYKRRVMFRNLGRGRRPTIEFFVTDPVQFKVSAVNVTVF